MNGKETSDLVEASLVTALQEMTDHDEGDILVEWVVVCYVANANNDNVSGHPILVSNDDMPMYRLRGLLHTALLKIEED